MLAGEALHAPHLIDAEVASVLRRMDRRGELSSDDATTALRTWAGLGLTRHSSQQLWDRVWQLRPSVTSYDATYLALAEHLGLPFVTRDARLSRAPGARCQIVLLDD